MLVNWYTDSLSFKGSVTLFFWGSVCVCVCVCVGNVGVRMTDAREVEWLISQLLFADDTALVAESEKELQKLVTEFGVVCERRKLKVNVAKSKVLVMEDDVTHNVNITLDGAVLEEVSNFKYLGSVVDKSGSTESDVKYRLAEGAKVFGAMGQLWRTKNVGREAKKMMYEGVVVPTVLFGAESWALKADDKRKIDGMEMRCLYVCMSVCLYVFLSFC